MPLNAHQVETVKPRDKAYKLADGGGLYLMVNTNGSKYWCMKYRFAGKEKSSHSEPPPDISLAEARIKRDETRKTLANDKDPGEVKKAELLAQKLSVANTFEAIALEWYNAKVSGWSKNHGCYGKCTESWNNKVPILSKIKEDACLVLYCFIQLKQ